MSIRYTPTPQNNFQNSAHNFVGLSRQHIPFHERESCSPSLRYYSRNVCRSGGALQSAGVKSASIFRRKDHEGWHTLGLCGRNMCLGNPNLPSTLPLSALSAVHGNSSFPLYVYGSTVQVNKRS